MARRTLRWLLLTFGVLSSCLYTSLAPLAEDKSSLIVHSEPGPNPWNHLQFNHDPQNFQFAIVTDRTGGRREGVFLDAVRKLNLLQPEFVMSVGDLIDGYTVDEAQLKREWDEFKGFIEQLDMPFFYLPGNHDISNEVMARVWHQTFGRAYYHFVYRDVLFLCLNSEDPAKGSGKGAIFADQFEYAKRILEEHSGVRWTLVFMHQPLWSQKAETGFWPSLEALLQKRKHSVFAGHYHHYVKAERNQGTYFVLATTGGWNRLRGPDFGEFDHVVWVTMTDAGPIVANLLLDGILDENVVDEAHRAFMEPYRNGVPLTLSPILLDQPSFREQQGNLKLVNDKNIPMVVALTLYGSDDLLVAPQRVEMTVAPNMAESVAFTVTRHSETPIHAMIPVKVEAEAVLQLEHRPPVRVQSTHIVKPEVIHKSAPAQTPPVLDGDLKEWPALPFAVREPAQVARNVESHEGPEDCSFRFGVQADDHFVYVGIEVTDDVIITKPRERTWRQDSIAVRLDARPLSQSAASRGGNRNAFKDFLYLAIGPGKTPSGFNVRHRPSRWPVGMRAVAEPTASGYAVEMAIPTDYLRKKQGDDWQHFRLNIAVDDLDDRDQITRIWWRPDWRMDATYAGSGVFRRP